jgi:hypothetical protein
VDFVAAKAKVGGGGSVGIVNAGKLIAAIASDARNFPPLLRGVVFLSQAHFGAGADRKGVGLGAVHVRNQTVVGLLGAVHTRG